MAVAIVYRLICRSLESSWHNQSSSKLYMLCTMGSVDDVHEGDLAVLPQEGGRTAIHSYA